MHMRIGILLLIAAIWKVVAMVEIFARRVICRIIIFYQETAPLELNTKYKARIYTDVQKWTGINLY